MYCFEDVNDIQVFKNFLMEYHKKLSRHRSFPKVGLQKSLQLIAPIFGRKNWHEMADRLEDKVDTRLYSLDRYLSHWDQKSSFEQIIQAVRTDNHTIATHWNHLSHWPGEQIADAILQDVKTNAL